MAREYHNLRGVVRDITRALREGDYAEVAAFVDILDDFADAREDIDAYLPDAEGTTGESAQLDLDLRDADDGGSVGGPPEGHGAVRSDVLAPPSVAAAMERARDLARAATRQQRHPDALATTLRHSAAVKPAKGA